jgi:nucleotide-binding universal stress UspA family protein
LPDTREIVVGYDGSPRARDALEVACGLAPGGARLTIVTVYRLPPEIKSYEFFEDLADALRESAEEVLESAREIVTDQSLDVHCAAVEGSPADALASYAREREADMLVVGCAGRGPIRSIIGSVTHKLLHEAPCPVLVVPKLGSRES